jgi:hypothetical protein
LGKGTVFTADDLNQVFTDWSRDVAVSGGQRSAIEQLWESTPNGVCLGLALSAGRFDSEEDSLLDPSEGRSDAYWGLFGSGPSASVSLPAPGTVSDAYDQQFSRLVADDFVTQFSTQVDGSLRRQHVAYADPNTGFASFETQIESVMGQGTNLFDFSGLLSAPSGTGFAIITIQTFDLLTGEDSGHAVLAYSAEPLDNGGLEIDVWDNNFPLLPSQIDVNPDGTWIYNAPYSDSRYQGVFSMPRRAGDGIGLLAVLPLFNPTGLHFYPQASDGLGSLVDVPPGIAVSDMADSGGGDVDVEPVLADDTTDADDGLVLDFPGDAGQVTLTGTNPALDVRGADSYMTLNASGADVALTATADEQAGAISATTSGVDLSVARNNEIASSSGAGGLTFANDGSVDTTNDSANTSLQMQFVSDGDQLTATLYSGATTPGAGMSFTSAQVAAAEAALVPPPRPILVVPPPDHPPQVPVTLQPGPGPGTVSVSSGAVEATAGKVTVKGHAATVAVACMGVATSSCGISFTLATTETLKGHKVVAVSAAAKRRRKRTVVVGGTAVTVAGGARTLVRVPLNGTGLALLSRLRKLPAQLTVKQGTVGVSTRHISFRAASR